MLSAPRCCHSADRGPVEAPGSVSESRWRERVTQQPEHQKARRDIFNAAAQSSPVHRTLGQVRTKGLSIYCLCTVNTGPLRTACIANSYFLDYQSELFWGFDRLFPRFYFPQRFPPLLHKDLPSCQILPLTHHQCLWTPRVLRTIHRTR